MSLTLEQRAWNDALDAACRVHPDWKGCDCERHKYHDPADRLPYGLSPEHIGPPVEGCHVCEALAVVAHTAPVDNCLVCDRIEKRLGQVAA